MPIDRFALLVDIEAPDRHFPSRLGYETGKDID